MLSPGCSQRGSKRLFLRNADLIHFKFKEQKKNVIWMWGQSLDFRGEDGHWNGRGKIHQRKPKLRDLRVNGSGCVGLQITGSGKGFRGEKRTIILNILTFWHFT